MSRFDEVIEKARKMGKVLKYKDFVNTKDGQESQLSEDEIKYYKVICRNGKEELI